MLEVRVCKRLGETLIDIEFAVPARGITVLYGHSGAGKTSVLNMIAGLIKPEYGMVSAGGRVLFDSEKRINIPVHRRRAGYIFQDKRLFPFLSVRKNLLFGAGKKTEGLKKTAELLGIEKLLERKTAALSGGEAQRVAIGRALLSEPDLLLMDEPMSSLDFVRKSELIPYIQSIPVKFGVPVVLVTHSYEEMARLADNVAVLENGRCSGYGTMDRILPDITYATSLSIAL